MYTYNQTHTNTQQTQSNTHIHMYTYNQTHTNTQQTQSNTHIHMYTYNQTHTSTQTHNNPNANNPNEPYTSFLCIV